MEIPTPIRELLLLLLVFICCNHFLRSYIGVPPLSSPYEEELALCRALLLLIGGQLTSLLNSQGLSLPPGVAVDQRLLRLLSPAERNNPTLLFALYDDIEQFGEAREDFASPLDFIVFVRGLDR
ncbi:hypothetical protein Droror1_Dr00024294 [Drosera rotundifolia]